MLALIGSALLLFVLIVVTTALTLQSKTAIIFLPADETVLLANKPTEESIADLEHIFPVLKNLSIPPDTENLALVDMPNGPMELVFFLRRDTQVPIGWQKIELPPFVVVASSQSLVDLLAKEKLNLSSVQEFKALYNSNKKKETWSFFKMPKRNSETVFDSILEELAANEAQYVSYKKTENGFFLRTFGTNKKQHGIIPTTVTLYLKDPILSITMQNLPDLWSTVQSSLIPDEADKMEGILAQIAVNTFGHDVSFQYDVLPLLEDTSTLEFNRSESGILLFAITGHTKTRKKTALILSKLHKSLEQTMDYGIETKTRILDDRFTSRDIRMNGDDAKNEMSAVGMWQIQQTLSSENVPIFTTAIRGTEFFVSNHPDTKDILESGGKSVTLPMQNSINRAKSVAGGVLNVPEALSLLRQAFSEPVDATHPVLSLIPMETILWSLSEEGYMRALHIEIME